MPFVLYKKLKKEALFGKFIQVQHMSSFNAILQQRTTTVVGKKWINRIKVTSVITVYVISLLNNCFTGTKRGRGKFD